MIHTLPKLTYSYDAMEPHIDARTMEIHYSKHHRGYVDKLNKALEGHPVFNSMELNELLASLDRVPNVIRDAIRNNGGGHANHTLFWTIMGPGGGGEPDGELAAKIKATFGSFEQFRQRFTDAALNRFGSGWAWLCTDDEDRLVIESTPNQDNPIMYGHWPMLGLDVWEHAYYLKYQNRRADYVAAWWNTVNWEKVAEWYAAENRCAQSASRV